MDLIGFTNLLSTSFENFPKENNNKINNNIDKKIFNNFFWKKSEINIVNIYINAAFLSPDKIIVINSPKNKI